MEAPLYGEVWLVLENDSTPEDPETITLAIESDASIGQPGGANYVRGISSVTMTIRDDDRARHRDASLSRLELYAGDAGKTRLSSLDFSPPTTAYTVDVRNGTSTVWLNPTAKQPSVCPEASGKASVTVDTHCVFPGQLSDGVSLDVGRNTVRVVVTAPDRRTTREYTVTVNRGAPKPVQDAELKMQINSYGPPDYYGERHKYNDISGAREGSEVEIDLWTMDSSSGSGRVTVRVTEFYGDTNPINTRVLATTDLVLNLSSGRGYRSAKAT